jgi:hypothetical protein
MAPATVFDVPAVRRILPELTCTEFSVEWTGDLFTEQSGLCTFDVTPGDGALLNIDDSPDQRPAVDKGGVHCTQAETGFVELSPGRHRVRWRYAQNGGQLALNLTWTPPGGDPSP